MTSKSIHNRSRSTLQQADADMLLFSDDPEARAAHGTPKTMYQNNRKEFNRSSSFANSNVRMPEMRRTRSALTYEQLKINRAAPALESMEQKHVPKTPGLVVCLNSKNVSKYSLHQIYKNKGVVVAIDREQSKIAVLNDQMPPGALTVVNTQNPFKYEIGYPISYRDPKTSQEVEYIVYACDRENYTLVLQLKPTI